MLNDLAWRKVPRNIIRDENIDYISSLLPENLSAAPMLLYFIMYCKADDDGVIDLEDGAIYARLMKICNAKEVLDIATLMAKRKLLLPVIDGSNVYIIEDWDIPMRPGAKPARTMEERRANVASKIRAEQEQKRRLEQQAIDFDALRQGASPFFCPHDDKNAKNVDTQRVERDKRLPERTENLEFREIEREKTHTESSFGGNFEPPCAANESLQEQNRKTEQETESLEATDTEIKDLAELAFNNTNAEFSQNAVQDNEISKESKAAKGDIDEVFVVFRNFFAKNCLGFNEMQHKKELLELSELVLELQDERNPATAIASVFCQQFKVLTETEGYYKNLPLYPRELLNPKVYRTVLSMASRILCSKQSANVGWIQQSKVLKDMTENRAVYDELKKAYVECGIDPNSEHPLLDFLRKKMTAIK